MVAIVTGGGSGIGRAAARALAGAGHRVVIADRDAAAAAEAAAETGATAIEADVAHEAAWPRIVAAARRLGALTVLVSNAGIFPRLAFAQTTAADFDRVMAVNLRAAFIGAAHCAPVIAAHGGGAFVFMTSGSGLMTALDNPMQLGFSLYGASKAALDRWALGIAPELAPRGIAVNVLCPGAAVTTPGFDALDLGAEAPVETIAPDAVARVILALAQMRPPETGRRFRATDARFDQGFLAAQSASNE